MKGRERDGPKEGWQGVDFNSGTFGDKTDLGDVSHCGLLDSESAP